MPALPRLDVVLFGALALLVLGLGVRWWSDRDAAARPPAATHGHAVAVDAAPPARLVVHVAGAVRRPGVYRLREGARVEDALRRAGGTTRRADTTALNLAAKLTDGRQVLVPARARTGVGVAAPSQAAGGPAPPVNLNTATEAELDALDGIGPEIARKIVEHRVERGGFGSVEELGEIPGIGPKRLESLRGQVSG